MRIKDIIEKIAVTYDVRITYVMPNEDTDKTNFAYFQSVSETDEDKFIKNPNDNGFISTSAMIFVLDIALLEFMTLLKEDKAGNLEWLDYMVSTVAQELPSDYPKEVLYVVFVFLHEVGHWNQFKDLNNDVYKFVNQYDNLYRANHDDFFAIHALIEARFDKGVGLDCPVTAKEKKLIIKNREEYRAIPKEKEADEFALKELFHLKDKLKGLFNNTD